jgi:hypothetical protein
VLSARFGAGVQRRALPGRLNTLLNEPAQDLLMGNSKLFEIVIEEEMSVGSLAGAVAREVVGMRRTLRLCHRGMA